MSLPVIVTPTYEVKLHSIAKPVKFRPYLVKEEKILLMAQAGGDLKETEAAVKQIIRNCTNDAFDVDTLASFDLEYLFLQLRAKSVNNVVELRYECHNRVPTETNPEAVCHHLSPVTINLDDVKVHTPKGHTKKIMLNDTVGVTLRYPTTQNYDFFVGSEAVDVVGAITVCLETIFTVSGDVHEVSETNPTELSAFVESLSIPQVEKIKTFFDTMPKLTHTVPFTCLKCGYKEDIVLSGLQDFFG